MSKGKKYTRAEWEAIGALKNLGMNGREISRILGRQSKTSTIAKIYNKFGGDYEKYIGQPKYAGQNIGKRQTEQLMFEAPVIRPPRKILVKKASFSVEELDNLTRTKLQMATKQAIAIRKFTDELKRIGFKF